VTASVALLVVVQDRDVVAKEARGVQSRVGDQR
jgi:hypothetical protein